MPDSPSSATPIVSTVLEDGTIIEAVHRPGTHETRLLAYTNGVVSEHEHLDIPGIGRVAAYSARNNLLSHGVVLLPSGVSECGTDEELFAEIRAFIHRYADLSPDFEELASVYVLLTWVYDAFPAIPYLRLKGDYGSGKSRCLQTMGSLSYKPIFASGASTASPLFRILDAVRGTLVLDESDFRFSDEKAELVKILNNGSSAGFPVLRSEATPQKEFNPRAFHVYGPKIVATRRDFEDRALESRCITEAMSGLPPRPDIPLNISRLFHDEARAIRNRLVSYRFRSLHRHRDLTSAREEGMEARVSQLFAPLIAVAPTDALRERVAEYARQTSATLKDDRSSSLEAQLLETIRDVLADGSPLVVKEIASRFAAEYSGEYERPITARWIGAQLRSRLSLHPVKSHGNFVVTPDEQKLAGLFLRYGIDRVDMGTSLPAPKHLPF